MPLKVYYQKNCNIYKKPHVLKSQLNKASDRKSCTFVEKTFQHTGFSANTGKFLKTYFEEHLCTSAAAEILGSNWLGLSFWRGAFKTIYTLF